MDSLAAQSESEALLPQSATCYALVDVSVDPYEPERPFKGLYIGTAGDLQLTGFDGETVTFPVAAGCWPFAGTAIGTDTTAGGIVALS